MSSDRSELPELPRINPRLEMLLEQIPTEELNRDERNLARLIARIPYGQLATYKAIADWAQAKHGYTGGNPRVVANLRLKLYEMLGHSGVFPLWRLATTDDSHASNDSIRTRIEAMQQRTQEGSWERPVWFEPSRYHDPSE